MNDEALDRLFGRVCDGIATKEEIGQLHTLMRADPAVLDAWVRYSALHGDLAEGTLLTDGLAPEDVVGADELRPLVARKRQAMARRSVWLQWRSVTAAAAGVVFGLFTASMMWAYVRPHAPKPITLLAESFESAESTLVSGVPLEPGIWRGNQAEIVGAQRGVKPAAGGRMLRFLRADYEGKPRSAGSHLADVYRLIDLRPLGAEVAAGTAVVEVSASFDATPFPADEKYGCAVSVYALDADTAPRGARRIGSALTSDSLAMARSSLTWLDRDPSTWQRLTTEMLVPANTEFLVVRLHITQAFDSAGPGAFTGSYADDVRVSITQRPPPP